jgi:hypothetical protein
VSPPFQYETRPNAFVGTIGDLIARQGEVQAAQAARDGQIWGGAIAQAAHAAGAIPQQLEQQKIAAMQTEALRLELDEKRRAARSRNIFEAELKNPANFKEDGTVDDQKLAARLRTQDVGAWQSFLDISARNAKNALDTKKTLSEIAKNDQDVADKKQAAVEKQRTYLGGLAFNTEQVLKQHPDDVTHARDTAYAALMRGRADGMLSPEAAARFATDVHDAPDAAAITRIFSEAVPPEMRSDLEAKAAKTAHDQAEAGKLKVEAANLEKFGRPTPPEAQHVTFRLDGKDVAGSFVPDPQGGKYFYNGQDVTARAQHIPAASIAINADKQNRAGENRGELVNELISGNLAPSMLSKRAEDYNATLADASKRYRELTGKPLNISKLQLDYEAAKRWVATQNGTQMVRYNGLATSVVNTIDEVQQLGDLLAQSGIQKWNEVKRSTIRQVYGNTPESELANRYVGAVNTLKEEFANLANGGFAPTDAAWHLANDQINADFGFKDLRASLTEVQRLINYRTQALHDQAPISVPGNGPAPATGGAPAAGTAPAAPAGWKYVPKPGGGWTAVRAE